VKIPAARVREIAGVAASLALLAGAPGVQSTEEWSLLAREGGCHPILSLRRRLADLPDIRDPDAFQAYLKAKEMTFARKDHSVGLGRAVEFVVESRGLALMFVTRELCGSSAR